MHQSKKIYFYFSGPQFQGIVMDQCQIPGGDKLAGGIRIKEDPNCDYNEAGEKCDILDKKGSMYLIHTIQFFLFK